MSVNHLRVYYMNYYIALHKLMTVLVEYFRIEKVLKSFIEILHVSNCSVTEVKLWLVC